MKGSRVASVQFEHLPGDKAANLAKVRHYAAEAAKRVVANGASLGFSGKV